MQCSVDLQLFTILTDLLQSRLSASMSSARRRSVPLHDMLLFLFIISLLSRAAGG